MTLLNLTIFSLNLTYTKFKLMLLLNSNCKTTRKIRMVMWGHSSLESTQIYSHLVDKEEK